MGREITLNKENLIEKIKDIKKNLDKNEKE